MKNKITLFIILVFSGYLQAQTDTSKSKFALQVTLPLNIGFGYNSGSQLEESNIGNIATNQDKPIYTHITFPGLTFIFKEKWGIYTGFNFASIGFQKDEFLSSLNNLEPNTFYYFNPKSGDGAYNSGNYTFKNLKIGFLYQFKIKNYLFNPFANFQISFPSFPSLEFESKPEGSNYFSKYTLKAGDFSSLGYEAGFRFSFQQFHYSDSREEYDYSKVGGFSAFLVFGQHFTQGVWDLNQKKYGPELLETDSQFEFKKTNLYISIAISIYLGKLFF